ncbi:MAG: translation initiation factor IF-3 [Candidatus Saelkia tenebricola]|nr:translation initiation factor IF-3 [Candidatus Saelkia tenebricola]
MVRPYNRYNRGKPQRRTNINHWIKAERIRLIDADGTQIGIVPLEEGLKLAEQQSLDLVEIAGQTNPPVCRVLDFSKFKYQQDKREKEAKKKQKHVHFKEVRLKPRIEEHDYQVKLKGIKKFLEKGDRVKIRLFFRGREMAHPELGDKVIKKLLEDVEEIASVEKPPTREGRNIICVLFPKH